MSDAPDLWDDAGSFLYRHLPETGIDDFFTEERDTIRISREGTRWWVNQDGVIGEDPHDTLTSAKRAADAVIEAMEASQDADLIAEARLDPQKWRVSYSEGLAFLEIDGERSIVSDAGTIPTGEQSWIAFRGDDVVAEDLPDLSAARRALDVPTHEATKP